MSAQDPFQPPPDMMAPQQQVAPMPMPVPQQLPEAPIAQFPMQAPPQMAPPQQVDPGMAQLLQMLAEPKDTRSRGKKMLGDALTTFMFSLGQGLQAQAQYPGGRGSQAGMGAALAAPQLLQQQQQQQEMQRQKQVMDLITLRTQMQQAGQQDGFSLSPGQKRFGPNGQLQAENPGPPAEPKPDNTALIQSVLQNPQSFEQLPAAIQTAIAPELARQGFKIPAKPEAKESVPPTIVTDKGIMQWEPATKGYTKKVGDRPKSAVNTSLDDMRLFTKANGLRDDYFKEINPLQIRADSYDFIDSVRNDPQDSANDLVLIYNFVKLQDPNAVREGELELVQAGAAIPDRWLKYVSQFGVSNESGTATLLGPAQRKAMIATADRLNASVISPKMNAINERYEASARRMKVDPTDVVRPLRAIGGGGAAGAPQPVRPGFTRIKRPDGVIGDVPTKDVPAAIKLGGTLVTP